MDKTGQHEVEAGELTTTVIAANVVVRGDIEGATDLHVSGRVLGGVSVTGLLIDEGAEIDGPVIAKAAVIGGHVNGAVEAKAVHIKATARIDGDVSYESIQIDAGGRVSGCLIVDDGEEPRAKPIDPAGRSGKPSEFAEPGQELVRLAARLRRASE